jgi:hypothetical protein
VRLFRLGPGDCVVFHQAGDAAHGFEAYLDDRERQRKGDTTSAQIELFSRVTCGIVLCETPHEDWASLSFHHLFDPAGVHLSVRPNGRTGRNAGPVCCT